MDNTHNVISIIIPVYKVENYLDQCIESVVNQTYQNLEIILVDDGSPDNCPQKCDDWAAKDKRISVIHKKNGGLSEARNFALDKMHGNYLMFVDSDDWIEYNTIEIMLDALIREDADYCSCGIINWYFDVNKEVFIKRNYFVGNSEAALKRLYNQTLLPVAACGKLIKSSTWGRLRFPLNKLYEDAFTTYKVIDNASKIIQIPDGLYHYRIRSNSIMTSSFSMKNMDLNEAWKENYLFSKQKYPKVEKDAHSFWLEHLPPLINKFPKKLCKEEKEAKRILKKEIINNLFFIMKNNSFYKILFYLKALFM